MSLAAAMKEYADANDVTIEQFMDIMLRAIRAMADLETRVEALEVEALEQARNEYSDNEGKK